MFTGAQDNERESRHAWGIGGEHCERMVPGSCGSDGQLIASAPVTSKKSSRAGKQWCIHHAARMHQIVPF